MRRLAGKYVGTIAIIALFILNVVLIVPLFLHRNVVPDTADAAPASPGSGAAVASGSPSPSPSGDSPGSPVPLQSDQPRRVLAVSSARIGWRAEPAGCGKDSKVEVTTDGGKTWTPVDTGLKSIVRLKASGTSSVFAIGADQNCQPAYASADSPDSGWQRDDSVVAGTWFRLPDDLNVVHDPQGQTSHPCGKRGLVDLAGLGTSEATVLCGDGRLRIRNGGSAWHTAVKASDAVALNADDNRFVMAERRLSCDGWVIQPFSLNADQIDTRREHCVSGGGPDPNRVAVSNESGTTWVWSGDVVLPKS